ncbi:hypothetical protein T11_7855, partial [Trichinella zimbabwensis]
MDDFVEDKGYMLVVVEEITQVRSYTVPVPIRRPQIYAISVTINLCLAFTPAVSDISAIVNIDLGKL